MGLVRDPAFWKRFSTAVHRAELGDTEMGLRTPASSVDMKEGYVSTLCYGRQESDMWIEINGWYNNTRRSEDAGLCALALRSQ